VEGAIPTGTARSESPVEKRLLGTEIHGFQDEKARMENDKSFPFLQ